MKEIINYLKGNFKVVGAWCVSGFMNIIKEALFNSLKKMTKSNNEKEILNELESPEKKVLLEKMLDELEVLHSNYLDVMSARKRDILLRGLTGHNIRGDLMSIGLLGSIFFLVYYINYRVNPTIRSSEAIMYILLGILLSMMLDLYKFEYGTIGKNKVYVKMQDKKDYIKKEVESILEKY
jgi:hypothetical protein